MFYRHSKFKTRIVSLALSASIAASYVPGMISYVQADDSGNYGSPIEATSTDSTYSDDDYSSYASSHGISGVSSILYSIDSNNTSSNVNSFPKSLDNSKKKYFPEIKSQLNVGSCNAWALCYYAFTYEYCRANDLTATRDNYMSPAFPYCQVKHDNVEGSSSEKHLVHILKTEGTPYLKLADFASYYSEKPNVSWYAKKDIWENAAKHRVRDFKWLHQPGQITSPDDSDLKEIKQYLNDGYVIPFSTKFEGRKEATIPEDKYHGGEKVVYEAGAKGNHKMTIVGYDDDICYDINGNGTIEDSEKGAFKIANSHGTTWGNEGFSWYMYDSINTVSVSLADKRVRYSAITEPCVLFVDKGEDQSSGLFMVIKINTQRRYENLVWIKAVNKETNEEFECEYPCFFLNNHEKLSFNGNDCPEDGELAIDLNNIISDITPEKVDDYYWSISFRDYLNDNYHTILKDAYIEYNGERLDGYCGNDFWINGKVADVNFYFSGKIEGLKEEPITEGEVVSLLAKVNPKGVDLSKVTYKFVEVNGDEEVVLKEDSADNSCQWTASEAGDHTIRVYMTYGSQIFVINENVTVLKKPYVSKLNYDESRCFANNKLSLSFRFDGGVDKKSIKDVYCVGGNYSDGPRRKDLEVLYGYVIDWTPDMDGTFDFYGTVVDSKDNCYTGKIGTIVIDKMQPLKIDNVEFTQNSDKIGVNTFVNIKANVKGGSGNYGYRFGSIYDGKEYYYNSEDYFSSYGTYHNQAMDLVSSDRNIINTGKNKFFVDVKDNFTGEIVREIVAEKDVEGLVISNIFVSDSRYGNKSVDEIHPGDKLYLCTKFENLVSYYNAKREMYYSTDNGNTYIKIENGNDSLEDSGVYFEFGEETGNVKFKVMITDGIGQTAEKVIDVNVKPAMSSNVAVIYYDNSWNEANIHYAVGNNGWTSVPGIKMEKSDIDGYKWKAVIDLANEKGVIFCFNDGNSNWDNNYNSNYHVTKGTYAIKNGNIEAFNKDKAVIYYNNDSFGNAKIHYIVNGGQWTSDNGVEMEASDKTGYRWMYVIDLKDSNCGYACFNDGNGRWDSKNSENYYFEAGEYEVSNGNIVKKY